MAAVCGRTVFQNTVCFPIPLFCPGKIHGVLAARCAFTITQYAQLEQLIDDLVAHPDRLAAIGKVAGDYITLQAGATDIIYRAIYGNTQQHPCNNIPQ